MTSLMVNGYLHAIQLQANRLEKKANLECTLKLNGAKKDRKN